MDKVRGWPHHIVKICQILEQFQPHVCIELGTYCGASAIPIAKTIFPWSGRLTCVDSWVEWENMLEFMNNTKAAGVADRIAIIAADSVEAGRGWVDEINFLYIDADHTYEGVRDDLNAWWPHVAVGGVICGDDYNTPEWPGVAQAWDEFEAQQHQRFEKFVTEHTNPPGMKLVWGVKT